MQKKIVYLETGSTDPAYNLAFEEHILHSRAGDDYLIIWQNDNAVIIGRNQNTEEEIDKNFVKKQGIKVVRRNTGGGAVFHDLGNLNFSFITDVADESYLLTNEFTKIVVDALRGLGLEAEASGRNDIMINGRKVSGTAQHMYRRRLLYHGTLLFDSDISRIAGALKADKSKFESKSVKSVASRVGNIRTCLAEDMTTGQFWDYLKKNLIRQDVTEGSITEEDKRSINALKKEKYDSWEWNFGSSPKFRVRNKRRWPGGSIEVGLTVDKGRIEDIAIYGDFLALKPIDDFLENLKGKRFTKTEITSVMERNDFKEIFGAITKEELLKTMFQEGDF